MNQHSVHFSSGTDEWPTPQHLFDALRAEFGFTIDVAATPKNAKCPRYFTRHDDGLAQSWDGEVVWMNPPYGRGVIDRWIDKAIDAASRGATVVALVPDRPGSRWYTNATMNAAEVRRIEGRLRFGDGDGPAPFPSCLFVFRPVGGDGAATSQNRPRGLRWTRTQLRPVCEEVTTHDRRR